MTGKTWLVVLLAGGLGLAVLAGILGDRGEESQADARQAFCSSLSGLESSTQSLTALSPTTATKDDYESALSDVDSAWDQVKTDAGDLTDAGTSALESSWNSFESTVGDVPDDATVSEALNSVSQAAQSLLSTTKSTISGPECSSS